MEQSHSTQPPKVFSSYDYSNLLGMCRFCFSGEKTGDPLFCPCECPGPLCFVHLSCLCHWIEKSGTQFCEFCRFEFIREGEIEPFWEWKNLKRSPRVQCKMIYLTTSLLLTIAFFCMALYMLIFYMNKELSMGGLTSVFWFIMTIIVIFFVLGLFALYLLYMDCAQLFKTCRPFNDISYMQNAPGKADRILQMQALLSVDRDEPLNPSELTSFGTKRISPKEDEFYG